MAKRETRKTPSKPAPPPIAVGACFAGPASGGRYAACQVIAAPGPGELELVALDWLGDAPPTLDALAGARVLTIDHHSWDGRPERCIVSDPPPSTFIMLGERAPLARFDEPCRSYGGWEGVLYQVSAQRWWDEVVPAAEVQAYRAAKASARETVEFVLGGRRQRLPRGVTSVRIGPVGAAERGLEVDPGAPLDWSLLDVFGCLGELEYEGGDPGVLDLVARRLLITALRWRGHGQRRVDAARAGLERLVLGVADGPLELVLGPDLETLQLEGYRAQVVSARHPRAGRGLTLGLYDLRDQVPPAIAGLGRLSALSLHKPRVGDLATLGYPALESLTITSDAGVVANLGALAGLGELRELQFGEVYAMEPEELPAAADLPKLASATFDGLRKADAATIKRRLAGVAHLEVRGARSDAWLAANADNPFKRWGDESPALGRAASKIYEQTRAAIRGLTADQRDALHAELLGFVRAFNRVDAKHGLDTIHREQIYDVFIGLAGASALEVDADTLGAWFDEDREF